MNNENELVPNKTVCMNIEMNIKMVIAISPLKKR